MRTLLLNSPWINTDKEYSIKSGTRWASIRSRDRFLPYFPYPYYLASTTAVLQKEGFDAHIKDAIAEEITRDNCLNYVEDYKPDVLVIEAFTPSIHADLDFMKEAKNRTGCLSIFCGVHPSALPDEILKNEFMDFVLMGEHDYTLRDLLLALTKKTNNFHDIEGLAFKEAGAIRINHRRKPIQDLDNLPFPIRDELPMMKYNEPFSKYFPTARMLTARGCPYHCSFCVEPFVYNGSYRQRSIKLVIEEIELLRHKYGIKEIFFDDPIVPISRAVQIAEGILEAQSRVKWSCWIDWNIKYDQLVLLKRSGCIGVKFGVESSNAEILKTSRKPVKIDRIRELILNCKKLGLLRHGSFAVGLPGETKETLRKTIDWIFSYELTSCQVSIATPLPGTEFYKLAEAKGWIASKQWADYEANANFVLEYPDCHRKDILEAMEIIRRKKVRQLFKHPWVLMGYLLKLFKSKGPKAFIRDVYLKAGFVLKSFCISHAKSHN